MKSLRIFCSNINRGKYWKSPLPPSLTVQLSNHSLTGWGNTPTTTHIVHTQWLGYTQSHIQGKNKFFDKFNICKHIYSPYSVKTICDQKGNALTN